MNAAQSIEQFDKFLSQDGTPTREERQQAIANVTIAITDEIRTTPDARATSILYNLLLQLQCLDNYPPFYYLPEKELQTVRENLCNKYEEKAAEVQCMQLKYPTIFGPEKRNTWQYKAQQETAKRIADICRSWGLKVDLFETPPSEKKEGITNPLTGEIIIPNQALWQSIPQSMLKQFIAVDREEYEREQIKDAKRICELFGVPHEPNHGITRIFEPRTDNTQEPATDEANADTLPPLPKCLDEARARATFENAVQSGYMERTPNGYKWTHDKGTELAFICGLLVSEDPTHSPDTLQPHHHTRKKWMYGIFPRNELHDYFGLDMGAIRDRRQQAAYEKRKESDRGIITPPKNYKELLQLFPDDPTEK